MSTLMHSQVTSTLIENGISLNEGNSQDLDVVTIYLERHLNRQNGVVGFGMNNAPEFSIMAFEKY
jgi:hypothetical protein